METFKVLFYDGQSSACHNASLTIEGNLLKINYVDRQSVQYSAEWQIELVRKVEVVNGVQVLRYGSFPQQVVECRDTDLISVLSVHSGVKLTSQSTFQFKSVRAIVLAALLVIGLSVSFYFYILPSLATYVAGKIPRHIEAELGNSIFNSFVAGNQKDKELSLLANRFAREIDFDTSYPIRITVVESDEVNAFALPGGNIVVYTGILKKMKTGEELAALLSHEVAHIEYKHSLTSISRSLAGYLFISIIFNDINGIATTLVDNANTLNNLSYSRTLETDADMRALKTLELNNLDQKGMVSLFKALDSGQNSPYLKFLITHPLTADRIKYAKATSSRQGDIKANPALDSMWRRIKEEIDGRRILTKDNLVKDLDEFE